MPKQNESFFDSEQPMRPEDIRDINRFEMVHYKKGASIIRQGDKTRFAYYLVRGRVKLSTLTHGGDEIIYDYRDANDSIRCIIGGLSMYRSDCIHRSSFVAETECYCRKMTRQEFLQFMWDHPAVSQAFIALTMERWSILDDNFLLRQAGNTSGQVCAFILSNAERRNNEYWLPKRMNNTTIARFVGANRVTVVRIMQELARRKLIEKTADGVHILNEQELNLYCSGARILQYRHKKSK